MMERIHIKKYQMTKDRKYGIPFKYGNVTRIETKLKLFKQLKNEATNYEDNENSNLGAKFPNQLSLFLGDNLLIIQYRNIWSPEHKGTESIIKALFMKWWKHLIYNLTQIDVTVNKSQTIVNVNVNKLIIK